MGTSKKKVESSNKYGPVLRSGKAEEFVMDIFATSRREKAAGRKGIPVCSWGEAGIGKTELPNLLVKKYKDFFSGNIVYLPMAQIEEKAELQGLPELQTLKRPLLSVNYLLKEVTGKEETKSKKKANRVIEGKTENNEEVKYEVLESTFDFEDFSSLKKIPVKFNLIGNEYVLEGTLKGEETKTLMLCIPESIDGSQTVIEEIVNHKLTKFVLDSRTIYATPSWIPQVSTHGEQGLLVIDDMNRADARIINSIMQLLQDGALLGWKLPEKWEIYCTCNPDNAEYDVTAFDGAQMTRMANYEQKFDKDSWLKDWAIPTGIHPIAQNFVVTYPEVIVNGERTNPRSFDKFFRMIHNTLDKVKVSGDRMDINSEGEGGKLAKKINDYGLMNIEETPLQAFISFLTCGYGKLPGIDEILEKDFDIKTFFNQITDAGNLRVDILSTINTRLILYIQENHAEIKASKIKFEGVKRWIKAEKIPMDLRFVMATSTIEVIPSISDKEISELVFSRLLKK